MKRLTITPEMQANIDKSAGTAVDPSAIAVYECVAVSREPIKKPNTIYDGARLDDSYYGEMAAYLESGASVPIHSMHHSDNLPLGRVFHAKETAEGLRSQFYVPLKKADVVDDIDNGVIGYVSIGALPKQLLCSSCDWDYRGPDASILNLMDRECPNEHKIGENGVHLKAKGLESWLELSLCGSGASPGAAILSRAKAQLASTNPHSLEVLAASGMAPEAVTIVTPPTGESTMNVAEFTAQLTASATQIATLEAAKTGLEAQIATLTSQLGTANTALEAATTAKTTAEAKVTTLEAKVATIEPELTSTKEFLKEQASAALIASGGKSESLPEDVAGMIASLKNSGKHLAQLIASQSAHSVTATTESKSSQSNSAFKTRS